MSLASSLNSFVASFAAGVGLKSGLSLGAIATVAIDGIGLGLGNMEEKTD